MSPHYLSILVVPCETSMFKKSPCSKRNWSKLPCGLHCVMRPWFDFLFWRYVYCLLVYIVCFPTYLSFFTFSLLKKSFENRPAPFQAGCHERRLNPSLVFMFILCCSTFLSIGESVLLLLGLVFPYQTKRLVGETSPKWPILCRVGRKTATQSIAYIYPLSVCASVSSPCCSAWRPVTESLAHTVSLSCSRSCQPCRCKPASYVCGLLSFFVESSLIMHWMVASD